MGAYFFQPHDRKGYRNAFVMRVPLLCRQVRIEISGHQKLCLAGLLENGRDNGLYG